MQSWLELRSRTAKMIDILRQEGIRVHPASRLAQYLRQLDAAACTDGLLVPKGLKLEAWHRALFELDDLHMIVDELRRAPEVSGWQHLIKQALDGGILPSDEVKHARARDIQFELSMAAMLRRAGYEVLLAEPDVLVRVQKRKYGLAAKRPRSIMNLDKAIRDADKQIARSGRDGFIALDLSFMLNTRDHHIQTNVPDLAMAHVTKTADSFIHNNAPRLRSLVDPNRTFGILVHFGMLVFHSGLTRLGYARRYSISNFCDLKDRRAKFLKSAAHRMPEISP
jgi:hypothetical protein